ncbi:906_t:CDS:2 [Paraglomus occultum]|uniref:906_t:CDS:1 n=1 Tax=Paraglomus occultum TaxID=144539 RepID=A0A9N8Z3G6_9GLOM|nr:906_t:CDS:2 [Paraglomus occultum]
MDKEATKFSPDNPATNKSLHSFLQFTTVRVPVLSSVDPVAQRVSKKRKASIKEAKREKEELQQKWRDLIFETYRKVDNGKFKEFLQKLMPRIDRSVQEEEDSGGTVSKRVRSDEQH